MSKYSMRLASFKDKPLITAFMDENWGEKHPLIHNEKFFNYYYVNKNELQFALCFNENKLCALCGYILCSKNENPDIWVSIWVASKGENGAGLELMSALPSLCGARVMSCNNIRPKTMPFYNFLGYKTGRLPHFYRLANKPEYNVCILKSKNILPVKIGCALKKISRQDVLDNYFTPSGERRPFKDKWYITKRYFDYPYQKYDVWSLEGCNITNALIVTRTVDVNNAKVLRIVDYTGAPSCFSSFGFGINELINNIGAEYADMYCYGIPSEIMADAGFCERTECSENIIPNYLTPPLYENTEYYFFTNEPNGFTMFKADGDQDRPNLQI